MNKLRSSGSSQAAKLEDEVKAKSAECCQLEAKLNQQGDYEDLKRELRLKVTNLCLCVCFFVYLCVCVFVCLFVCLFICLFVLFFHATTTIITSLIQSPLYFLTTIHFSHFTPNATTTIPPQLTSPPQRAEVSRVLLHPGHPRIRPHQQESGNSADGKKSCPTNRKYHR